MFRRKKPEDGPDLAEPSPESTEASVGVPPYRPAPQPQRPQASTPAIKPPMPPMPPASQRPTPDQGRPGGHSPGGMPSPGLSSSSQSAGAKRLESATAALADRRTLVVGRGIALAGTITDCERLVVEGTVEATVNQGSEILIAAGGVFRGEIEIDQADIHGTFDGTLTARDALVVRSTGRVLGIVRCRRLTVEEGGEVSGKVDMLGGARSADRPQGASAAQATAPALAEG